MEPAQGRVWQAAGRDDACIQLSLVWIQPKWPAMSILRGAGSAHRWPWDSAFALQPLSLPFSSCFLAIAAPPERAVLAGSSIRWPRSVCPGFSLVFQLGCPSNQPWFFVASSSAPMCLSLAPSLCQCCPTASLPHRPQVGFAVPILLHRTPPEHLHTSLSLRH